MSLRHHRLPGFLRSLAPRGRHGRKRRPSRSDAAPSISESKTLCLGLAALLGSVLTVVVYPPSFLLGDAARFHSFVFPNDALNNRLAWQALVDRGRPWPSLWTDMFNYPRGFPISLMDGLPLAATLFRPIVAWLPAEFHYFGLWHAVAVVLQAIAGAVFVRAAGVRDVKPCLAAAAFAVTMPIFVGRLNWTHVSLSTHGLLILALALCIHVSRVRETLRFAFPRAAALSLVSLAVHPLLALQVLFFCLLSTMLAKSAVLPRASAVAILCLLFAGLCHALGIFEAESFLARRALGTFGFSPLGMLVGEPDSLRERHMASGPGIEQDAWLGWGCVLLLAVGLVFRPRIRIPHTYHPLAGAIAVLVIIAVSPWVRIGTQLWDLSSLFPDSIIDLYAIHRATVRLAWPLVTCLSLLALVHVVVTWPPRRAILVLGVAFALQIYSVWPYWTHEYRDARAPVTHVAPLPAMLDGGSVLVLLDKPYEPNVRTMYAMYLAVESGLPLAGGRFSRPPPARSADLGNDVHVHYTSAARYLVPAQGPLPQIVDPSTCVEWEVLRVCRAARGQARSTAPRTATLEPPHD